MALDQGVELRGAEIAPCRLQNPGLGLRNRFWAIRQKMLDGARAFGLKTIEGLTTPMLIKLGENEVKTVEDVDLVRREVERSCRGIGKPVALVANYDGFYLDPGVSDTYFSMIAYLEQRYYSSASRYSTSAFMRLKLGEGLSERNVAPHIFETQEDAQQFTRSQRKAEV